MAKNRARNTGSKNEKRMIHIKDLIVKPDKSIRLKDYATKYTGKLLNKNESETLLDKGRKKLAEIQDKLYAHNRYSVLIISRQWTLQEKTAQLSTSCQGLTRWA